jgi:hypothetical protein
MSAPVLKPLALGETLDVAFGLYRNLFLTLLIITVVTRAAPLVLSVFIESAGGAVANLSLYLFTLALNAVLGAIAAAASTFVIAENYMGRRLEAGEAFARAGPFVGRLILLALLSGLVIGLGFLLLIVPGLILFTGLILATPALVLEGLPTATKGMGRSWMLTRGHRWRVFGALVVVGVLLILPFLAAGGMAASSLPLGEPDGSVSPTFLLALTAAALLQTLIYPLFYCVLTVLYYDLRVRKEAYDLEVLAQELVAT